MTRKRLYIVLAFVSLAGYLWLGLNLLEGLTRSAVPSVCLFKEVTGLPCPSCGTTRSLLLLIQGRIFDSFMMNPFGIFAAIALATVPLWILADTVRRSESFYRRYVEMEQLLSRNRFLAACAAAIVTLNWFWNIAKGL